MKYALTEDQLDELERRQLRDRERDVLTLYYRRGWAIEDVAAEIGYSRRTVDRVLRAVREKVS